MTWVLWTIQGLLALLFLFAGSTKLLTPADTLAAQSGMSGAFLQFIGLCEALGALGLVLPGAFRIQEQLTALAASGLVVMMVGATAITAAAGLSAALPPFAIGILCAVVACGRWPSAVRRAQPRRRRNVEAYIDPSAWYAPQI